MNVNMCKRCGAANNLKYIYKGDYYCDNNRCLRLLFQRLVEDNCIIIKKKDGSCFEGCYDSYYNSRGEYIGNEVCTNKYIISQIPEIEEYSYKDIMGKHDVIKFRAWDNEKGMIHSEYIHEEDVFEKMYKPVFNERGELKIRRIRDGEDLPIMQGTGYKDCSGTYIYEDDIIQFRDFHDKFSFTNEARVRFCKNKWFLSDFMVLPTFFWILSEREYNQQVWENLLNGNCKVVSHIYDEFEREKIEKEMFKILTE